MNTPSIIYLDQNKWIDLARAQKKPDQFPQIYEVLERLVSGVDSKRLLLPLTSTNIYETHKIYCPEQRHDLARLQATLSGGKVLVGRERRLSYEIERFICSVLNEPVPATPSNWFISDLFFEAFADLHDPRVGMEISEELLLLIRDNPAYFLYDFWMNGDDRERQRSVKAWSEGTEILRQNVEQRRDKWAKEPKHIQKRAYSALLAIESLDRLLTSRTGWASVSDIGPKIMRRFIEEVPVFYTERELALKIEGQNRSIDENDFRDMVSFCAALPYADTIIAEKQFVNLASQAKLDKHFETRLETKIEALI